MAKASLVNREMGNGELLVKRLDEQDVPIDAAFWLYDEEAGGYRLMLATSLVDTEGARSAYGKVLSVLKSFQMPLSIDVSDISIISPSDPFVTNLRRAVSTGGELGGIRLSRTVLFGEYVEDAYIYRS